MSQFVTFKASTDLVRRENLSGKTYVIAPVVAIRQGVLNGELSLAEEIGKFPESWNGIPVPLGHPNDEQGLPISANTPELVAQCPGRFWRAHMIDDRLAGEIWIDEAKAQQIGGDALVAVNRLNAGTSIEVSTAYFRDLDETEGEWEGQPYAGIQRNMRPDHLALLLHERGACNWKMGCGVPRTNSDGGAMSQRLIQINLEMSLDDQLGAVYDAFSEKFISPPLPEGPGMYIREVFADRVIVSTPSGLYAYPYTMDADGNVAFGSPVQVEVVYQEVAANQDITEEQDGTPAAQAADQVVIPAANAATPCPLAVNCSCPHSQQPTQANEDEPQEPEAAEPVTPANNAQIADAALNALALECGGADALRQMLAEYRTNQDQQRRILASEIMANERNTFGEEALRQLTLETLQKIRDILRPNDYSGRGGPRSRQPAGEIVESPMPNIS